MLILLARWTGLCNGLTKTCGGYLAHPFANQMDVLVIASCFSELWHSQMKEYKSISRVNL